jgi:hypothetical protein
MRAPHLRQEASHRIQIPKQQPCSRLCKEPVEFYGAVIHLRGKDNVSDYEGFDIEKCKEHLMGKVPIRCHALLMQIFY